MRARQKGGGRSGGRKGISGKHKKAQLKAKRAAKRRQGQGNPDVNSRDITEEKQAAEGKSLACACGVWL